MNWNDLERHFSTARLGRYRSSCAGDERKAVSAYVNNMLLAGAMTPMLSVLEIALRNGIHRRMSALYQRPDWWEAWSGAPVFARQIDEVMVAKGRLQRRAEIATPDKIVAELAFGFWSSLFNGAFTAVLWKDLRLVFPRCPRAQRKRQAISSALNQMRDLRNRIFHHEQLIWLHPDLPDLHANGTQVIGWIDPQLVLWLAGFDPLPATWATCRPR
ncbi:hypothetical protein LXA47_29600 [Massilia sp. P8910]|uniref:hypothetical protein n=1 Tax=Massilia antarctica TaxID=2765360 RepID=UPI0006BB6B53|nr:MULTISPECIES: hypothetical protein [Massilia]MCE3607723.1 hypothetical protein [Massilia antarctica]MCY0912068.1 hypothetical protein [Massilia sp. H27-R4]CUI06465.1 TIORF34 protein [Janthinobacterium sp. CG23_2]CUU30251.1 TIORF34 protein [Janthinobacterium sp. CG23_2]